VSTALQDWLPLTLIMWTVVDSVSRASGDSGLVSAAKGV
jgi:hypothetical protein